MPLTFNLIKRVYNGKIIWYKTTSTIPAKLAPKATTHHLATPTPANSPTPPASRHADHEVDGYHADGDYPEPISVPVTTAPDAHKSALLGDHANEER